jgi:hypothetical protein
LYIGIDHVFHNRGELWLQRGINQFLHINGASAGENFAKKNTNL